MKKRIGSKLYDTDRATLILPDIGLYKQPARLSFFLFDGGEIRPVTVEEARDLVEKFGTTDDMRHFTRRGDRYGRGCIWVSAEAADALEAYCERHGVTQKSVIEGFIASLKD